MVAERMAGDWESAAQTGAQLVSQAEDPAVQDFLCSNPLGPLLLTTVALTGILVFDLPLAKRGADLALRAARQQNEAVEELHSLELLALLAALAGDARAAEQHLRDVDRIVRDAGNAGQPLPRPEFSWVDGQVARALTGHLRQDAAETESALDTLLPELERMEQWPLVVMAESAYQRTFIGPGEAFSRLHDRLVAPPSDRGISPRWQQVFQLRLAALAVYAGHYQQAEELLAQLVKRTHANNAFLAGVQARLALFQGDFGTAYTLATGDLEASLTAGRQGFREHCELLVLAAVAAHRTGRLQEASQHLAELASLLGPTGAGGLDAAAIVLAVAPQEDLEPLAAAVHAAGGVDLRQEVQAIPAPARLVRYGLLSPAEQETLQAMAHGGTLTELAHRLFISPNTVKSHQRAIYSKLNVSSRAGALATATRLGWLP